MVPLFLLVVAAGPSVLSGDPGERGSKIWCVRHSKSQPSRVVTWSLRLIQGSYS